MLFTFTPQPKAARTNLPGGFVLFFVSGENKAHRDGEARESKVASHVASTVRKQRVNGKPEDQVTPTPILFRLEHPFSVVPIFKLGLL